MISKDETNAGKGPGRLKCSESVAKAHACNSVRRQLIFFLFVCVLVHVSLCVHMRKPECNLRYYSTISIVFRDKVFHWDPAFTQR